MSPRFPFFMIMNKQIAEGKAERLVGG